MRCRVDAGVPPSKVDGSKLSSSDLSKFILINLGGNFDQFGAVCSSSELYESFPAETRLTVYRRRPVSVRVNLETIKILVLEKSKFGF